MAYRPNDPNDPFITQRPADAPLPIADPVLEPNRIEEDGSISGTRIALYAVAVLAIVGALFYGMSATNNNTASNSNAPANSMAERPATPPPAVRDVTPRNNTEPGMTTGSAPAQTPAPANPAGTAQ